MMAGYVDVHGHITHPELFKRFPSMPPSLLDIAGMLDRKSALGIGTTIVGSPVGFGTMMPVPGLDNYAQPLDQLASYHEWIASQVEKYRPRLAAYVYVNPFGGEAELTQAARTAREGPFVGLITNTSVKGQYLDAPGADDFFAMADELGVPIFLHPPQSPVGSDSVSDFRIVEQVGRFLDVTMCLAMLVFSGRLEQHPDLRFLSATAGGAIGLLGGRLDSAYSPQHYGVPRGGLAPGRDGPRGGSGRPKGRPANRITSPPTEYLGKIYVDTSNISVPNQLANLETMGPERMLFGTDSPPLATPLEDHIAQVRALPISESDQEKILGGNARELFGLA